MFVHINFSLVLFAVWPSFWEGATHSVDNTFLLYFDFL